MREDYYSSTSSMNCTAGKTLEEEKIFESLYNKLVEEISALDYYSSEIYKSLNKLYPFELEKSTELKDDSQCITDAFRVKLNQLKNVELKFLKINEILGRLI